MLYKIEIENFYSIRETQVLDLTVAANVPDSDGRFAAVYPGSEMRVPKVVAIYGANASGKTTILQALSFVTAFISASALPEMKSIRGYPFNDEESAMSPTRIAVELGAVMNPHFEENEEDPEYGLLRYELVVQMKDGQVDHVVSETLQQRPQGRGKWVRVFERVGETLTDSVTFRLGTKFRHLISTLRADASVISSFSYFNFPPAEFYANIARQVFTNLGGLAMTVGETDLMTFLQRSPSMLAKLNRDLSRIDVGIEQLRIEDVPNRGPEARFKHSGHGRELPWHLESQGTQAFVRLFPLLTIALDEGAVALVDEFDTLIHPLVLPEILRWFYDNETRNREDAQIWMSCHSATLLEYLVKEEVVIAEKDTGGRTSIYSLTDVAAREDKEAVRRSANLYKKYLSGAFGGVPVIG
ncbi:AAA family ATPase [Asticcacaulis excentricus]|uniref:Abortive infection protein n=1 Tax=Asticcacaulis excentricus (strain ATCC 15261 / DSM 4724 / KCTC 12464 / NCIMB 9791 / VKM B-1370 / CB 48) TaxID=573065 RepID=E8RVV6_ASTEC|nr:ATP-binding protein [Asticcacaulis excentricus]ADU15378.1 abortive infection protein [Asticcacaulis excentricus CB 48]